MHKTSTSSELNSKKYALIEFMMTRCEMRTSAPSPRRGPTGLHRTQFRNPNRKSRKREKEKRSEAKCFLSHATRLAQQKLFTISKFRLIFVALIPVINYTAQIVFKIG